MNGRRLMVVVLACALIASACGGLGGDGLEQQVVGVCDGVGVETLPEHNPNDEMISQIAFVIPGDHFYAIDGKPKASSLQVPDTWLAHEHTSPVFDNVELVGCLEVTNKYRAFSCNYTHDLSGDRFTEIYEIADFDIEVRSAHDGTVVDTFTIEGVQPPSKFEACVSAIWDEGETSRYIYNLPAEGDLVRTLRDLVRQ